MFARDENSSLENAKYQDFLISRCIFSFPFFQTDFSHIMKIWIVYNKTKHSATEPPSWGQAERLHRCAENWPRTGGNPSWPAPSDPGTETVGPEESVAMNTTFPVDKEPSGLQERPAAVPERPERQGSSEPVGKASCELGAATHGGKHGTTCVFSVPKAHWPSWALPPAPILVPRPRLSCMGLMGPRLPETCSPPGFAFRWLTQQGASPFPCS